MFSFSASGLRSDLPQLAVCGFEHLLLVLEEVGEIKRLELGNERSQYSGSARPNSICPVCRNSTYSRSLPSWELG